MYLHVERVALFSSCRWIQRLTRPIFRCGHFHYRKEDKNKHRRGRMLFLPARSAECRLHKYHMAQAQTKLCYNDWLAGVYFPQKNSSISPSTDRFAQSPNEAAGGC